MWLIVVAAIASETEIPDAASAGAARTAVEARFQRIDRDRNGFITANEAPRVASQRISGPTASPAAASWIENYDSDRDARVSAAEYFARSMAAQGPTTLSHR